MLTYKPGAIVPITFAMPDEAGGTLTPTALRWRILDENEAVIQTWTTLVVAAGDVTFNVPATLTALTPPALRGFRIVELEITSSTGAVYFLLSSFLLVGESGLAFGINTFQTYGRAILVSQDLTSDSSAAFLSAERPEQERALIEAFNRILLLPLRVTLDDAQNFLNSDDIMIMGGTRILRYMTPAQMQQLYVPMLDGLKKAQVIEACEILNGDPVTAARANGLMSMTVGESSQFFRPGKPLDLGVSPKTVAVLQRWLRFGAKIGRS